MKSMSCEIGEHKSCGGGTVDFTKCGCDCHESL